MNDIDKYINELRDRWKRALQMRHDVCFFLLEKGCDKSRITANPKMIKASIKESTAWVEYQNAIDKFYPE